MKGQRAQSSNPNATQRYAGNRLNTAGSNGGYNRNVAGAQSHNYDKKRQGQGLAVASLANIHGAENTITSNGSFPGFSSEGEFMRTQGAAGGFRQHIAPNTVQGGVKPRIAMQMSSSGGVAPM